MGEDSSATLTCLALFSSHGRRCFVSSLENLWAITVLGGGRWGGFCTRGEGGGGGRPGQGSSIRPGLVPSPHPVLSQLGHLGALTKQNLVTLRPRPRQLGGRQGDRERAGAHSLPPGNRTGQGPGDLGFRPHSGPRFPKLHGEQLDKTISRDTPSSTR